MKEIEVISDNNALFDELVGFYKVTKEGLDDVIIVKNYKYNKLMCNNATILANGESSVSVTQVENRQVHVVKPLETLGLISKQYGVDVEDIKKINNLKTNKLFVGQIIKL